MGSVFPEAISYSEIAALLEKMITEPDFGKLFQYGASEGKDWHRDAAVKPIAAVRLSVGATDGKDELVTGLKIIRDLLGNV